MSAYTKALVAVVGAVLMAVYSGFAGDNHIGPEEAINIGIAAFTALNVYIADNALSGTWRYAKSITAAGMAVLNLLVSQWTGGIDNAEIVNLVIAAAVALGVYQFPNKNSGTTLGAAGNTL
jgi:hypothetical protein